MSLPRVVHAVRSDSFSGVERYICDVTNELSRRGWQVAVVGGAADAMRRELPAQVEHWPAVTTAGVGRALLRVGRCGLVHVHMTAAELAAAVVKPARRYRLVTTRHFASRRGSSVGMRVLGPALRHGLDRQISISQFVADSIGEPSTVIHNGVPTPVIKPAAVRDRTVAVMQRHEREKQTDVALRAWAAGSIRHKGWGMVITGRGSLTDDLKRLAASLGVSDSVTFAGFVDDPRALLRSAGIFLATAPAEPFGLSVVEAMAHGLPVVASAGGAHLETLDGTARLFPVGDVEACARELEVVALDKALSAKLGAEAAVRQRELFSLDRHVDALIDLYEDVLR